MNGDPTGAGWPDEINLEDEAVLEMARRTNPDSNPRPNPIPLEPKVPIAPEKKKKTFKDEQLEEIAKLPPELQPYGAELIEWIGSHENPTPVYNTLVSFLQYRNTKFKIIPGNGFYFSPADGIISVSTPFYKEMKEKVGMEMTPMQFIFGAMHEFAHLKAMIELNDAGLQNMLRQFDYVQNKKFAKPGEDGKPAFYSAGGIYAFYYNILEDVIVNTMVENTELYGANFTEGKKNRQEVTDLYTEKFFAIHLPAGAGQGDYTLNGEEFVKIEQGQGDYKRAAKEDYDRGFDWTKLPVPMRRASQFTTYLMKNQMIGLSEKSVFDPEKQPDGKHILDPDVAMIFTRPLVEVYKTLLQKVAEKYKNDPEKYLSYLKFMTTFQKIQTWGEKNGEVVETESHKVLNVMSETCVTDLKINFDRAALNYEYGPLSNMINQYGLEGDITSLTFLQVFNQFKELNFRAPASGTIPFKYNLLKRTQVIRETLEPIFSLLLILDDSFKAKEAGDPPPSRTGRIVTVNKDSGSGVSSVVVVWDKRSDGSSKNKNTGSLDMASGIDEGLFSGEIETIFDPDKNLILLVNKPKKGKKPPKGPIPKKKDPRDKEYKDDDDDEDEDDDDEEDDDEDEDEDGGDGVPSDEKDDKKPKDGDDESEDKEGSEDKNDDEGDSEDEDDSEDEGKEGEDDVEGEGDEEEPDSIKELRGYKKFLKKLQRQRAREKRLKKIEDELNGNKFRKNRRDLAEEERLLGILKSKAGEFGKGGVRVPEVTREAIREVMKLEDI
ncbi:MAG: hypothetical protein NTW50_05145, partial [Candidatus Berkelbacteria bacterium]|nr:hypothetical protein [Candidatus Berkelbacteria bacterium]